MFHTQWSFSATPVFCPWVPQSAIFLIFVQVLTKHGSLSTPKKQLSSDLQPEDEKQYIELIDSESDEEDLEDDCYEYNDFLVPDDRLSNKKYFFFVFQLLWFLYTTFQTSLILLCFLRHCFFFEFRLWRYKRPAFGDWFLCTMFRFIEKTEMKHKKIHRSFRIHPLTSTSRRRQWNKKTLFWFAGQTKIWKHLIQ